MPYVNNKGADQPAQPRSLISAFVVRCLDSIITLLAIAEISRLQPVSVVEQAGLSLTLSQTPEDRFSHDMAYIVMSKKKLPTKSHRSGPTGWLHMRIPRITAKHYGHSPLVMTHFLLSCDKTNKMTCAPSEDSNQPGHPPSLIRVFACRMKKTMVHSYPLSAQRRL